MSWDPRQLGELRHALSRPGTFSSSWVRSLRRCYHRSSCSTYGCTQCYLCEPPKKWVKDDAECEDCPYPTSSGDRADIFFDNGRRLRRADQDRLNRVLVLHCLSQKNYPIGTTSISSYLVYIYAAQLLNYSLINIILPIITITITSVLSERST